MKLSVIGCSDAFSSGGRYHSCYLLDTSQGRLMLDCGANATLGLKRAGVSVDSVDAIVVSHCHGDHFAGLPFVFLDRLFVSKSSRPLEILGPPGIEARVTALIECMYPGLLSFPRRFELVYREIIPAVALKWQKLSIIAYEMAHFSGVPSLSLRLDDEGKIFAFSGDSGWCEGVLRIGTDADLYLIECTTYSTKTDVHLDYLTLTTLFEIIGAKRYLLTHMSEEMLMNGGNINPSICTMAEDGMTVLI